MAAAVLSVVRWFTTHCYTTLLSKARHLDIKWQNNLFIMNVTGAYCTNEAIEKYKNNLSNMILSNHVPDVIFFLGMKYLLNDLH